MLVRRLAWLLPLLSMVVSMACAAPLDEQTEDGFEEHVGVAQQPLSSFDCRAKSETGYEAGQPFSIKVVSVDGELVERNTANAYYFMAKAAAKDGVQIRIVSGFRTMAEQQYLYNCYVNCSCNNCNLAAVPGYSNHQSGEALDLNTSQAGVLSWLNAHADKFGFVRTVPSEAWHWEYKGKKPVGGPCGTLRAELVGVSSDAPADPSGEADYLLCGGESFHFQVQMRNVGTARWAALGGDAQHVGERVRLTPKGAEIDPLTGKGGISVAQNLNHNVLPASWGGGAGEPCNDAPGCRRTVFTETGIEATAPIEPGIYLSSWRLRDFSPVWQDPKAFGPTVELSLRVEACAPDEPAPPDGEPPEESAPPDPTAADAAAAGAAPQEGGCAVAVRPRGAPWLPALLALLFGSVIRGRARARAARGCAARRARGAGG